MSELRIVPLGGLGEVGMNCLALEYDRRMVLIDCGVTFPDHGQGIDVIHPDFSYVAARAADLEAVVLTHGHEDHIGALPYLLRALPRPVPVHGPGYTLGLVTERLREAQLDHVPLHETAPRRPLHIGPFEITPYRVTHSMPASTGLVVRAGGRTVIHSGDFKIESDPIDGEQFDAEFLAATGARGVDLLLSDSTNSETEGEAGGERQVAEALAGYVERAPRRIVVGLFASNLHRLSSVLAIARRTGRRVLLLGRALHTHTGVADRVGLLKHDAALMVGERDAQHVPPSELLVVATGSQGEPRAALRRLAHDTHSFLRLEAGDEVLLSARAIPGRERDIHGLLDAFERRGIRVYTRRDDPRVHVSGHACRAEQRRLIELTRPRTFVPIHGSFVHLQRHAALARSLGVPDTVIVENGAVLCVDENGVRVIDHVPTGRVHIQQRHAIAREVMQERARMGEYGLVIIAIPVDGRGDLIGPPTLSTRGLLDAQALADLEIMGDAQRAVTRALAEVGGSSDPVAYQQSAERAVRRVFRQELGFRPLVHAVVQRVSR